MSNQETSRPFAPTNDSASNPMPNSLRAKCSSKDNSMTNQAQSPQAADSAMGKASSSEEHAGKLTYGEYLKIPQLLNLQQRRVGDQSQDRKSTHLNSSHVAISYAVFCLKKKKKTMKTTP